MNPTDGRRHSATGSSSIQDPSLLRGGSLRCLGVYCLDKDKGGKGGLSNDKHSRSLFLPLSFSSPCWIRCEEFLYFGLDGLGDSAEAPQDAWQGQNVRNGRKFNFVLQEQPPVSRNTTTVTTAFDNIGTVAQDRGPDWKHQGRDPNNMHATWTIKKNC